MMGNYKPRSYMYIFLKSDIARITRKLATGGVTMDDLGSAGCCGVRPLDRENLCEVLAAGEARAKEKLQEAEAGFRKASREYLEKYRTLDDLCYLEARRVPRFCETKKNFYI